MKKITIYHNSQCSKSRKTLELIQSKGLSPLVIEYLKTPLTLEQLHLLRSHFALNDFIRTDEPVFKKLRLSLENEEQVMEALVNNPQLLQRPIITLDDKAIIGRPPEKVLELLN